MEKIVLITFDNENDTYQAFKNLQIRPQNRTYTIDQMTVIKKMQGMVTPFETFEPKIQSEHFPAFGGIVGGLIGMLGGPLGVFVGATAGLLTGGAIDQTEADDDMTLVEYVGAILDEGSTALVVLVDEEKDDALNEDLSQWTCMARRWDADVIGQEVEGTIALQEQMARDARKQLREQRKANRG